MQVQNGSNFSEVFVNLEYLGKKIIVMVIKFSQVGCASVMYCEEQFSICDRDSPEAEQHLS